MANVRIVQLTLLAAALVAAAAAWTAGVRDISAQSGEPTMRIVAPTESISEGDKDVPFEVYVDNVTNLASFQFVMQFDPDVFEFASAQQGPFLGSSEREVVCPDTVSDAGSLRFSCNTLRDVPAGPDGSGHVATILLNAKGSGSSEVTLDRVRMFLVDADATEIEGVVAQSATVDVASSGGGANWAMWGVIIVGAIIVIVGGTVAAMRLRAGNSSRAPKASPQ